MDAPEADDDDSAYDAGEETDDNSFFTGDKTLDTGDDIEDKAEKITARDIKKAETQPTPIVTRDTNDDDIDVSTSDVDVKLLYSKQTGKPNLIVKSNGKVVGAEEVPAHYLELAMKHPHIALDKIKADKAAMIPSYDDSLMEAVKKDLNKEVNNLRKKR